MNSRKQFEAWFLAEHEEVENSNELSAKVMKMMAHQAWQAAFKASEQQLSESRREFTEANATIHNLELKVVQVVAENAALKSKGRDVLNEACKVYEKLNATISSDSGDFIDGQTLHEFQFVLDVETPATDAYQAELRAQARNEGVNYAASRLAAAFNHGFVDKPLAEVYDVVRMILTTKEDLAKDPSADGLSGEYAEKSLVEFAAQLRQGAKS